MMLTRRSVPALVTLAVAGTLVLATAARAQPFVALENVDRVRAGTYEVLDRFERAPGIVGHGDRRISYIPAARSTVLRTRDTATGTSNDTPLRRRGCIALDADDRTALVGCYRGGEQREALLVNLQRGRVKALPLPEPTANRVTLIERLGTRWLAGRRCISVEPGEAKTCTAFYRNRRTGEARTTTATDRDLDSVDLTRRCRAVAGLLPDTPNAEALDCTRELLVARATDNPSAPAILRTRGSDPKRLLPGYTGLLTEPTLDLDEGLLVWTATARATRAGAGLSTVTGARTRFAVRANATVQVTRHEVAFADPIAQHTNLARLRIAARSRLPT